MWGPTLGTQRFQLTRFQRQTQQEAGSSRTTTIEKIAKNLWQQDLVTTCSYLRARINAEALHSNLTIKNTRDWNQPNYSERQQES